MAVFELLRAAAGLSAQQAREVVERAAAGGHAPPGAGSAGAEPPAGPGIRGLLDTALAPWSADESGSERAPRVHLAPDENPRWYQVLDWGGAPPRGNRAVTPQDTGQALVSGTLEEAFRAHRRALLEEILGAAQDVPEVLQLIAVLRAVQEEGAAEELRRRLWQANVYAAIRTLNVTGSPRYLPGGGKTYCDHYTYDLATALGAYFTGAWWTGAALRRIAEQHPVFSVRECVAYAEELEQRAAAGALSAAQHRALLRDVVVAVGPHCAARRDLPSLVTSALRRNGKAIGNAHNPSATTLCDWMARWGEGFGWRPTQDVTAAQRQANDGYFVVLLAKRRHEGAASHVSVVIPEWPARDLRALGPEGAPSPEAGTVSLPLQSQAGGTNELHSPRYHNENEAWWSSSKYERWAAWVWTGRCECPLASREELGMAGQEP